MEEIICCCVNIGNYMGRGEEYVEKLRSMVARHLSLPHRFECIRESDKPGWWAKVDLFQPGRFEGRVLYFDLDTVIVRSIDRLAACVGILHLADWGWTRNDYGSGVMAWNAGEHAEIYEQFDADVPRRFRGDQDWMTHLGGWTALPKGECVSYKYHCRKGIPDDCSVVCFHGPRKPHCVSDPWVAEHWI